MDRQPPEPSAFSQYLATNYPTEPDYVVHGPDGDVLAAKWHRPASQSATQVLLGQHTLMYHIGGSTSVAKRVEGRCVGTRSQHGSLTFSPRDERNEWVRGGVCEVMHVYIAPALIERHVDENFSGAAAPEIDPMFAVHDPWLQSYFMMLQSEFEVFGGGGTHPDALLLTQSMELLIRHLACWHSNLSQNSRKRAAAPAAPHPLAPRRLAMVSPISTAISAATSRWPISRSSSAFPRTISFAAFARPRGERPMPIWSSAASPAPSTRFGMARRPSSRSRAMRASRAPPDFPTSSRSTMGCRQASSGPGRTDGAHDWLYCLVETALPDHPRAPRQKQR
jgi:hypothetical protein